jgi:hypothetical protein
VPCLRLSLAVRFWHNLFVSRTLVNQPRLFRSVFRLKRACIQEVLSFLPMQESVPLLA